MGERNARLCLLLLFPPQKQQRFAQGDAGRRRGGPGGEIPPTMEPSRSLLEGAAARTDLTPPGFSGQPGIPRVRAAGGAAAPNQVAHGTAVPCRAAEPGGGVKGFMPVKHGTTSSRGSAGACKLVTPGEKGQIPPETPAGEG